MIVSQFVIGGETFYRLLLTNLAANTYDFRVSLRSHLSQVREYIRCLLSKEGWFRSTPLEPAGEHRFHCAQTISLGRQETALLVLEAQLGAGRAVGHLELTIPVIIPRNGGAPEPQGDKPVPVLLHASQHPRYEKYVSYAAPGAVLMVSTGKAENEIMPDQPSRFSLEAVVHLLEASAKTDLACGEHPAVPEHRYDDARFIEDPRSLVPVLAYLGRVGEQRENVETFNELLRKAGHEVRLKLPPVSG